MNKLMAEALVECRYADRCSHQGIMGWMIFGKNLQAEVQVFADTFEGRRQLDALFFYTLLPDKQVIISGDGHFNTREQMINHVNKYFKQLAEKDDE